MILPADMPDLVSEDLQRLLRRHESAPAAILRGAAGGQGGHPVLLPADLVPALAGLTGDRGARDLLAAHQGRVALVALAGTRAVQDLDTPADWSAWEAARDRPSRSSGHLHPALADPLAAALARPSEAVLAVITAVHGASYRSIGTMMCLFSEGESAGSLTNGCIEGDLALHAARARAEGRPIHLRYGAGSPFFDIRLPCGGAIEVALYPSPDARALADLACLMQGRAEVALAFGGDGALTLRPARPTGWEGESFIVDQPPGLRFLIFGEGAEAAVFARLVHSAGYDHLLLTPSAETMDMAQAMGCAVAAADGRGLALLSAADPRCAVVTFYHDHEAELPILAAALDGPAFYIGAQGSRRVAERRLERLAALGVDAAALARLRGPIGLVPSARDARTLAVSVLAEVVAVAAGRT
jgi:xanthine dehydrogenase accessory factor